MPAPIDDVAARATVASEVLKLLANASRLRIVYALLERERSVTDLAGCIDASVPATSQHLHRMRTAQVVRDRRDGTTVYYSLLDNHVAELVVQALEHAGHVMESDHHPWPSPPPGWVARHRFETRGPATNRD